MHFLRLKLLYLSLFLLFTTNSFSQSYLTTQVSRKSGLASNHVTTVFIDSNNKTWVGTDAGVYLFVSGKLYDLIPQNGGAVLKCSDIKQDDNQDLWFATYGNGLYKYAQNQLQQIDESKGLLSNKINRIYIKDELIYIGTDKGLSIYNTETQGIISPKIEQFKKYLDFPIVDFAEINNQLYFITPNDGVFKIINQFKLEPRIVKVRNHDYVTSLFLWQNKIYEGNLNAIKVYNADDYVNNLNSVAEIPIHNANRFINRGDHFIAISRSISGDNGSVHFIYPDNSIKEYKFPDDRFSNSYTKVAINDKTQKAYVATQQDGLMVFDMNPNKRFFKANHATVTKIKDYKEKVIIVYNDRIEIKNKKDDLLYEFDRKFFDDETVDPNLRIHFLNVEVDDDILFVQTNIGKFKITKDFQKFIKVSESEAPIVLQNKKPYCFKKHTNQQPVNEFIGNLYAKNPNSLPNNLQEGYVFDDKIVVLTNNRGLFLIEKGEAKSLVHNKVFPITEISFIQKTQNNTLVVATETDGIFEFDLSKGFKQIKKIPASNLRGETPFFVDNYGPYMIIGTESGIEFFSEDSHFILGESYGLPQNKYITGKVIDDDLYIGGQGGYYKFNIPDFLLYDNKVKNVAINAIFDENKQNYYTSEVEKHKLLKVSSKQNALTIDFIPFTKKDTKGHLVRYKTQPNGPWSSFSAEHVVHIPDLNKKSYQIELEFLDVVNKNRQKFYLLTVEVDHTNWVLIGVILVICICSGFLVFLFYKSKNLVNYLNQITNLDYNLQPQKDAVLLPNASQPAVGTRMVLNALNSHFIFNAISYFQYLLLQKHNQEALQYNEQFAVFFRNLLYNGSQTTVSIQNEINYIKSYLEIERSRFDFTIDFDVIIEDNLDTNDALLPSFVLHPIVEILLNHSFYENSTSAYIKIYIDEVDDASILITYQHNGESIAPIATQVNNRFYNTLQLLEECIKNCNQTKANQITYISELNQNKISFKLYV